MIELTVVSFVAGVLTVLAPCILPLLPVIVGGSILHGEAAGAKNSLKRPIVIVFSLAFSIILFTLLLKATTLLLNVPVEVWSFLAGGIVTLFGVTLLFPSLWENLMIVTGWQAGANRLMARSQSGRRGNARDVLLGAALGPVFNSCSPTYALIVAVILPASFVIGMVYLVGYALGVASILLLLSLFGRALADKLRWLANPEGWFKKIIAFLFIVVGVAVVFGFDKKIQTYVLERGWYEPVMRVEEAFRK